jgi:hypothetical protein
MFQEVPYLQNFQLNFRNTGLPLSTAPKNRWSINKLVIKGFIVFFKELRREINENINIRRKYNLFHRSNERAVDFLGKKAILIFINTEYWKMYWRTRWKTLTGDNWALRTLAGDNWALRTLAGDDWTLRTLAGDGWALRTLTGDN